MESKIQTRKILIRITTITGEKLEGSVHVPAELDRSLRLSDVLKTRKDGLLLITGVTAHASPVMVNMSNVMYVELLD